MSAAARNEGRSAGVLEDVARLAAEQAAALVVAQLPPLLKAALDRRDADRLLSQAALARYLGVSVKALGMKLSRGSSLGPLALTIDGKRRWRRSDVDSLLIASGEKLPTGGGER